MEKRKQKTEDEDDDEQSSSLERFTRNYREKSKQLKLTVRGMEECEQRIVEMEKVVELMSKHHINEMATLEQRNDELFTQIEEQENTLIRQQQEMDEMRTFMTKKGGEEPSSSDLIEQLAEANRRIKNLQMQSEGKGLPKESIADLEKKIATKEDDVKRMTQELEDLLATFDTVEKTRNKYARTLDLEQYNKTAEVRKNLQKDLDQMAAKRTELQEKLTTTKASVARMRTMMRKKAAYLDKYK